MNTVTSTGHCHKCHAGAIITWSRIHADGGRLVREDPERIRCDNGCTYDPLELNSEYKHLGPAGRLTT